MAPTELQVLTEKRRRDRAKALARLVRQAQKGWPAIDQNVCTSCGGVAIFHTLRASWSAFPLRIEAWCARPVCSEAMHESDGIPVSL